MITLRLTTDVQADRRVVLTLPPEVPTGHADLVITVESQRPNENGLRSAGNAEGGMARVATKPTFAEAPLPQSPFLTQEICAPCSIPWPEGKATRPLRVAAPMPTAHDLPTEE